MIRKATLLCLLTAIAGGSTLFAVSHQAQQRERELARLQRDLREARASIAVLETEWAYLNQLDRLQQLATRHLGLAALTPDRILRIADLPFRPPEPAPELVAQRAAEPAPTRVAGDRTR